MPVESIMRFAALMLAWAALPVARGDEWPTPVVREVFSPSRSYFVRVIPGKSWGDTVGFSGSPKGPYAAAEFYRLEKDRSYRLAATVPLLNPVAPVEYFVTDGGFLFTLDNWHNMGYGKVVALYTPEGKPVRSYELSDLFSKSEIEGFSHSVSSIAWRKSFGVYIRPGGDSFNITTDDTGGSFIFELSGAYQYCETQRGNFLCRTTSQGRKWGTFREPSRGAR